MRILHTSDWHLGVSFHDQPRGEDQRAFLAWLLDTLRDRQVDALVVAGDVFDVQHPPAEAQSAFFGFLADLGRLPGPTSAGGRRTAVIVGGNHDSAARLDAPREVLRALDAHVVGGHDPGRDDGALADPAGVVVPLRGAGGHVAAAVAAVPYLHEYRLGVRALDDAPAARLARLHDEFAAVYARLADRAAAAFPGVPLVATGHLTCLARAGDRTGPDDAVPAEIHQVGSLGALPPSIFDPRFGYVALGHIHRGFSVDDGGRVRYCGTPLQVSVVEPPERRRVVLVDLSGPAPVVESLRVPQRRRLVALRGTLDEVIDAVERLPVEPGEEPPYVAVEATLAAPDLRARARIEEAVQRRAGPPLRLAAVQTPVQRFGGAAALGPRAAAAALSPHDAFAHAWRRSRGADAPIPPEVAARFEALLAAEAAGTEGAS